MVAHFRDEHGLPDGRFRRRHFTEAMFLRRVDVLVPERYFSPPCPDPGAEADVVEPLTCIAWRQLRQRSDAVNSIWEVERFLHMLHALLDYADFPTASASSQGHDGHLPRVPDVVRWFFDYGVAKFTPSRAITRRPRGCWGWQVAKVSEQARLARTMLPWPSQKPVPRRRAKSKVCGAGLVQWRCCEVEKSAQPPPPTHPTIGHGIGVTK